MTSAAEQEITDRTARVAAEDAFGELLRSYIIRGEARFVDVARGLGMRRNDLYEVLDGAKHCRAAWLPLLPSNVEILYLRERAAAHKLELRATSRTEETFGECVAAFGACLTACGMSEADGHVSADEAKRDLDAIEELEQRLANVKAQRRAVLAERGRMIRAVGGAR